MKSLETDPRFYGQVFAAMLPITLQNVITIGVNMLDTIMLGSLGETALAAASLANQYISFFHICCMGLGMGASVLIARFYGARDGKAMHKTVALTLRATALFAAVFVLPVCLAPQGVIRLFTSQEPVIRSGARYLIWSVPTFFLEGLALVCANMMRSANQLRVPLAASVTAFFVNIGANYVFIFGHCGMPRMETAGAALGTVIARLVEFLVICGYFLFRDERIRFRVRDLTTPCADLMGEYFRISFPVLISDGLLGLGNSLVAVVMGHIGAVFVSANAITSVTQQISTVFIQGLAFTSGIITGQTLGEGRTEDARRQGYTFFWLGLVLGCAAGLVIFLIRGPVIAAYRITPQTQQVTEQLMDAIGVIVVFQSVNSILTKGVLRGGGDTRFLMVADVFFLWVVALPLGAFSGLVWHLPAFWIYFCLKIDQFIKAFWCLHRLKSDRWIKSIRGTEG